MVKPRSGSEIFLSARGTRLTTARIWQIVKKHARHSVPEMNIYLTLFSLWFSPLSA